MIQLAGHTMFQPDITLYHMWNLKTQEEFFATNAELSEQGVLISHLKAGISNHCRGITLFEKRNVPIKRNTFVHHHMWDHNTGESFLATTNELRKRKVQIHALLKGTMVCSMGVCLFENKHIPMGKAKAWRRNDELHHMWDHKTQEEFRATSGELNKNYGVRVDRLKDGEMVHQKGICLFENKDKPFTLYKPRK